MSEMCNDTEFRKTLESLDPLQQREVAVMFVNHVLPLCQDKRLERVLKIAADADASDEELAAALKTAHAVTFDSHARCGADCHWSDQAGYFVARAAVAVEHALHPLTCASEALAPAADPRAALLDQLAAEADHPTAAAALAGVAAGPVLLAGVAGVHAAQVRRRRQVCRAVAGRPFVGAGAAMVSAAEFGALQVQGRHGPVVGRFVAVTARAEEQAKGDREGDRLHHDCSSLSGGLVAIIQQQRPPRPMAFA